MVYSAFRFPAASYRSLFRSGIPLRISGPTPARPRLPPGYALIGAPAEAFDQARIFGHGGVYRIIGQQVELCFGQFFRICCDLLIPAQHGAVVVEAVQVVVPMFRNRCAGCSSRMHSSMASSSSVVVKPPMPQLYKVQCRSSSCKNSYNGNCSIRLGPTDTCSFFA